MDYQKIVDKKSGEIVEKAGSIFEQHRLICKEGHFFKLHTNDIITGEWCERCKKSEEKEKREDDSVVGDILKQLSIPYEYREIIDEIECDYVIKEGRKFIILIKRSAELEDVDIEGYNQIVIDDLEKVDRKQIWEAIKDDKNLTYIPPRKKKDIIGVGEISVDHGCEIEEKIYQCGKSEVCSIVKEACRPYPEDCNHGVAYVRVSTREQAKDGFSLEAQERYLFEEALKRNLFLRKIYIDKGISGGSTEKRAALAMMREEIKEGDWVLSCYISRIARNTKDLLSITDEIQDKGCHFMVRELDMDFTSPQGKLVLTLMASQAQFERDQTSERVKGIVAHLKKTGQFRSKPHFGWKMNPDRSIEAPIHIRNEEEMKVIKRLKQIRNKFPDLGKTAFARKLNELKVLSSGKPKVWHHAFVGKLMEREGMPFLPPRKGKGGEKS